MSEDLNEIFLGQNVTNLSNYSGVYQTGVDYQKFDFVYNTGDGLFYYARQNIANGSNSLVENNFRISLIPDGPQTSEGESFYILDSWNQPDNLGSDFKVGQSINISGSQYQNDGLYKIVNIQKDLTSLNNDSSLTGAAINVIPVGDSSIDQLELESSNTIYISSIIEDPRDSETSWSNNLFFFDADYGSTATFKANNYRYEYGNGYYINQPKNINSLTFEVDLKFKNRTNREANAIIHFLENHQGQHEQDKPSPNLEFALGISGFRWDGASTFHPYDSIDIQTKKFYCSEWSHNLNFENSNDVNVKLRNLDTSLLNKSEQLYVDKADAYSNNAFYEKNDIVFSSENHRFYYWKSETSTAGKKPIEAQENWSRENGSFKDINTEYWTRDFFWKPSLGLNINEKPRMKNLMVGAGYTQIYRDGINESLLTLNLQFNNRDDAETRAILHFLEHHYGCIPFVFSPPAPYEGKKNFICEEWSHTYNYKNNHSISATFRQYPFNFSAQQYDSQSAPPPKQPAEAMFLNPFIMSQENVGTVINYTDKLKKRFYIKNIGDYDLQISNISVFANGGRRFFNLGTQTGVITGDLSRDDYIYYLPDDVNLPYNLKGKYIKLSKAYTDGPEGGSSFVVMRFEDGEFVQDQVGPDNIYFQDNRGRIKKGTSPYVDCDYFIISKFFDENSTSIIPARQEGYIDIVSLPQDNSRVVTSGAQEILIGNQVLATYNEGVYYGYVEITSNGLQPFLSGLIKIYVV